MLPMPRLDGAPAWTPDEAALWLQSDAEALAWNAAHFGLEQVAPGRYDATDLLRLHHALLPFQRCRDSRQPRDANRIPGLTGSYGVTA